MGENKRVEMIVTFYYHKLPTVNSSSLTTNSSFINTNILKLQEGNSLNFMDLCSRHTHHLKLPF